MNVCKSFYVVMNNGKEMLKRMASTDSLMNALLSLNFKLIPRNFKAIARVLVPTN